MQLRLFLFLSIFIFSNLSFATELRLASTTSTKATGLLDILILEFEKDYGYTVKTFSVGTGTALRMGRQGKVDVLLVHAPVAEQKLVNDGYGILRTPVMKNDFVVAGPESDPAKIHLSKDVKAAFRNIIDSKSSFISRADDSGTHKKELAIWNAINTMPYGDWYYELGSGMSATLSAANKQSAYVLVDRGTWLAKRKSLNIILHVEADPLLDNPYHVIAVNPEKNDHINYAAAQAFIKWITGKKGKEIINHLRVDNELLFKAY